ncbi:MAG: hypothetical protein JXB19_06580 [Bacteroidales bacterium]|nr:hypothetical protein [Bacteroidales bacterium]
MQSLFVEHDDAIVDNFVDSIGNDNLQVVGSELILGKIYNQIGYPDDGGNNFFKIWYCAVWYIREASLRRLSILQDI